MSVMTVMTAITVEIISCSTTLGWGRGGRVNVQAASLRMVIAASVANFRDFT